MQTRIVMLMKYLHQHLNTVFNVSHPTLLSFPTVLTKSWAITLTEMITLLINVDKLALYLWSMKGFTRIQQAAYGEEMLQHFETYIYLHILLSRQRAQHQHISLSHKEVENINYTQLTLHTSGWSSVQTFHKQTMSFTHAWWIISLPARHLT